jgi:hypothetical protein
MYSRNRILSPQAALTSPRLSMATLLACVRSGVEEVLDPFVERQIDRPAVPEFRFRDP